MGLKDWLKRRRVFRKERGDRPLQSAAAAALFAEVNAALRWERGFRLWKNFGPWIIGAMALFVAGIGVYEFWQSHRRQRSEQDGILFQRALEEGSLGKDNLALWQSLAESKTAYGTLARFKEAAFYLDHQNPQMAYNVYRELEDLSVLTKSLRAYARLMAAISGFSDLSLAALAAELAPLSAQADGAFFGPALEILVLRALADKDVHQAEAYLKKLEGATLLSPYTAGRLNDLATYLRGTLIPQEKRK